MEENYDISSSTILESHFQKFSSIENGTNKHIMHLENYGYLDSNIEWVVMEKIHGANFSFITNGVLVATARRSGMILKENFFSSDLIAQKYHQDILEVYRRLSTENPEITTIQIFGEIFGGYYQGYPQTKKPVQKEVYYNPTIDYLVFDIKINTSQLIPSIVKESDDEKQEYMSWYLSQDEVDKYLLDLPLLRGIPITKRGTFDQVSKVDPVFITTIPALYGLPEMEKNWAEGYILKTNCRHPCNQSRPIIKLKNNTVFGEVMPTNEGINYVERTAHTPLIQRAISYCTQNRFNNTISKIGLNNRIEKITGIYISDAIKDFTKELSVEDLDEYQKVAKKVKVGLAGYLMKENFIQLWLDQYHQPVEEKF